MNESKEACEHATETPVFVSEDERETGSLTDRNARLASLLLHTRGYVILKGAVPAPLAQDASATFRSVFEDCVASRDGDGWYQVARETAAVFWERNCRWRIFPRLRPPFDSPWLLANPLVLPLLLRAFDGKGFYCKFISSDTCLKGALLQSPHRELNPGRTWDTRSLVVNIPLTRCGLDNGPPEVWYGGSHLWRQEVLEDLGFDDDVQDDRNPEAEELAGAFPSRKVLLEPGDLLIRDPGMMHRGTVNETDEPRSMLTVCYMRNDETCDYGEVKYSLDREMWESLEPEVKDLFAHAFSPEEEDPESVRGLRRWIGGKSRRGKKAD